MYSRTQSVQHIVGLVVRLGLVVVGRCCWGLRRGGITKDSPEHGRTVLVIGWHTLPTTPNLPNARHSGERALSPPQTIIHLRLAKARTASGRREVSPLNLVFDFPIDRGPATVGGAAARLHRHPHQPEAAAHRRNPRTRLLEAAGVPRRRLIGNG